MLFGDFMPRYPMFEYLKKTMAEAKANEKGVRVEAFGHILCEISKIQNWVESYTQFVLYENEHTAIFLFASDVLFIDNTGPVLILRLKNIERKTLSL